MTDLTQAIKSFTEMMKLEEPRAGMAKNLETVLLAVIPAVPRIAEALEELVRLETERTHRELCR